MEKQIDQNMSTLTVQDILQRMDKIAQSSEHLQEAFKALGEIPAAEGAGGPSYIGDIAGQAKAEAIGNAVQAREMTNQKMIGLLEKMYGDLRPDRGSEDVGKLQAISSILENYDEDEAFEVLRDVIQQMFVKPGAAIVR